MAQKLRQNLQSLLDAGKGGEGGQEILLMNISFIIPYINTPNLKMVHFKINPLQDLKFTNNTQSFKESIREAKTLGG